MRGWFGALPIARKLVVMTLVVSAVALTAAVAGLAAFDVVRFRSGAADDTEALARVIAENTSAALAFDDANAASDTLSSLRVRPVVVRACVYRTDHTVLAEYGSTSAGPCPLQPQDIRGWRSIASYVPVTRNGRSVGGVYVQRALSDLAGRIVLTAAIATVVLLLAGMLAFALSQRLQRIVSGPIAALADAARAVGREQQYEMPRIAASNDEVGQLVAAFGDMVNRVRTSHDELRESNEALQLEVAERQRIQMEREDLLVREREASRLKDEFLATVSHEMRTPLNAILGWIQILSTTNPSPQTMTKAIASLGRNAEAQKRVIEDLIDVSRIVTGKLQMKLESVDLRTSIEAAVEVVGAAASAKQLHLEVVVPDVPCIVHGDRDRLRQVWWNLLSNAVKFTAPGGVIRVHLTATGGNYRVSVSDTGVGISPAFLPYVFERFRQADGTMTREHGGLGLGLAIVKELSELHGGGVSAASDGPGRGATFTVTLPEFVGPEATGATRARERPTPTASVQGARLLVVDDNPDALEVIATALSSAGADVHVASSGADAIAEWDRTAFDMLICDLAMPQMDGFDVLNRIRKLDAARRRWTAAIAVTAYASQDYRARCLAAGFQQHFAKPLDVPKLIHAVAGLLGSKENRLDFQQ